jgi:uncharacterized protein YjbI with pentapeptide repeats
MNATVAAAIIAGGLTLIGTVTVQILGRRATKRDLREQGKQLDRTLAEQRARTLNERFATAASQLGDDKPPRVQLAGVYAMAGLADDWPENQQTCIDVLCAYLRMPYETDPGGDAHTEKQLAFQASREVRHTVIRVIGAHLNGTAPVSWCGRNFDFTGVVFDGGDFGGATFSGGKVTFLRATFSGGIVNFSDATFSGGEVSFNGATFSGGAVDFYRATFSGGEVAFLHATFSGGKVTFTAAAFSGGKVYFVGATFSGGTVGFALAKFSGGKVSFTNATFSGAIGPDGITFSGGKVDFDSAAFSGGEVSFGGAAFSGGMVYFDGATFSGGTVDFRDGGDWSHPPGFGRDFDESHPPAGVTLRGAARPSPGAGPHTI